MIANSGSAGRVNLVRKIAFDTMFFVIVAMAGSVAAMISRDPGSADFVVHWKPEKLLYCLLGAVVAATLVAGIRLRMVRRAHPEALD